MIDYRDKSSDINIHYYKECSYNSCKVAHRIAIERIPHDIMMTDGRLYRSTGFELEFFDGSCWDEFYNVSSGNRVYFK